MSRQTFLEAYASSTTAHPFARHLRVWEMRVCFELTVDEKAVHLGFIQALFKGQGDGTKGLVWITNLATRHDLAVTGDVQRVGTQGLSVLELRRWYKRHGFSVSKYGGLLYDNRRQCEAR